MLELGSRLTEIRARDHQTPPEALLYEQFEPIIAAGSPVDAQYLDTSQHAVLGVAGLPFRAPIVAYLLQDREVFRFLHSLWRDGESVLVLARPDGRHPAIYVGNGDSGPLENAPCHVMVRIADALGAVHTWAGSVNDMGEHVINLKSPSPGPHFFVNLLLGNRIGFDRPLQTTPKSVVDRLGRGSFRSHAAAQVLATRWDFLPEENGFPANRQFYLLEDGRQIFYSADPMDPNVEWAQTVHGQNYTTITYRIRGGLEVVRVIFLLPQVEAMPPAVEVQSIWVYNHSGAIRDLRLVTTGMFGAAAPEATREDVVYSTLSMQTRVFSRDDGSIAAISPYYQPTWAQDDVRFYSMVGHQNGECTYPTEICASYADFVGQGTIERPVGIHLMPNKLARKGPGFFALGMSLQVPPGQMARVDGFTGLVSSKIDQGSAEDRLEEQIGALLDRYTRPGEVDRALARSQSTLDRYTRHVHVRSDDPLFDSYMNRNLPFQILYQTFVSRSFDQTQKGHREIGFREVQDLMASMPFFIAMGERELARDLLREWTGKVFGLGYAYHNFYWVGKEPGDFSDDALWLVQALSAYMNQTGDFDILDEECEVAGANPPRARSIYETVKAIIRYSSEISIGKHGMPLLDRADWNDTLRLDYDYLNGPQKEEAWRRQIEASGDLSQPFQSEFSESVMNAFLLKIAIDAAIGMARKRRDGGYAEKLQRQSAELRDLLQQHAWKGDFFARVLFNRDKFVDGHYDYLGAHGDGLSDDPNLNGTYFLNSFNWAILADVATEDQIRTMLRVVKRALRTPHGLKLCSPVRYRSITARGGSGEYFPGDRENGGVFKHADMMAVAALLKAAREVRDRGLAAELRDLAYEVIEVVLPFRTMKDPFVLCGNPRFCTQYNNSETGENVGPIVSGTASWLWLALMSGYGVQPSPGAIELDPMLPDEAKSVELSLRTERASYRILIRKPEGLFRSRDGQLKLTVDGQPVESTQVLRFTDGMEHRIEATFA